MTENVNEAIKLIAQAREKVNIAAMGYDDDELLIVLQYLDEAIDKLAESSM